MALLMGAVMAIIMLGFMLNMYKSRTVNLAIFIGAALTFALTAWLVRSQVTVTGTDYMQAMIPHHSIAILTSERSGVEDHRVRKLADEIIEAQRKEIAEMKYLLRAIEAEGTRPGGSRSSAEQVPAGEAARRANVAQTDLESITDDELRRVLGNGPVCRFGYSSGAAAVAAATAPGRGKGLGVIKMHGRLVSMEARYQSPPAEGFELSSDDVRVVTMPYDSGSREGARDAEARLLIGNELDVGYGGFYECTR